MPAAELMRMSPWRIVTGAGGGVSAAVGAAAATGTAAVCVPNSPSLRLADIISPARPPKAPRCAGPARLPGQRGLRRLGTRPDQAGSSMARISRGRSSAMTTAAENETLTRVGPGTPMGELLRRYWWPVGISEDLKRKPTYVRLLGEDLVLFRDWDGKPGVLAALCSHRQASLCFGTVGQAGLRCRYHGWCYDTAGRVL